MIIHSIPFTLLLVDDSGGHQKNVPTTVTFDPRDPHAVKFVFCNGPDKDVTPWVLGRELLADGVASPRVIGQGDIQVGRCGGSESELHFALASPGGYAILHCPLPDIEYFLEESYAAVPISREDYLLELDDVCHRCHRNTCICRRVS